MYKRKLGIVSRFNNASALQRPTGPFRRRGHTAGGQSPRQPDDIPLPYLGTTDRSTANQQQQHRLQREPLPIMSVVRNLTTPYVWNWTLNLQHAFTPNFLSKLPMWQSRFELTAFVTSINRQ